MDIIGGLKCEDTVNNLKEDAREDGDIGRVFLSCTERSYSVLQRLSPPCLVADELEILAGTNSEEQFRRMVIDLFGLSAFFYDKLVDDFYDVLESFSEKNEKIGYNWLSMERVQGFFGEEHGKSVYEMMEDVESHWIMLITIFHRIVCAYDLGELKGTLEKLYNEAYGDEDTIHTADHLFPEHLCVSQRDDRRKKGKSKTLTHVQQWYALQALLQEKRNPWIRDFFKINNLTEVSKLFGELFNCHEKQLKNEITEIRRFDELLKKGGAYRCQTRQEKLEEFARGFLQRHIPSQQEN